MISDALPNSSIHESAKNGLVVLVRPPPHQRRRTENRLKNLQKCEKEINGLLNFIEDEEGITILCLLPSC